MEHGYVRRRVTKGGTDYYDSFLVQLYASWGLDFIKADDMFGVAPTATTAWID